MFHKTALVILVAGLTVPNVSGCKSTRAAAPSDAAPYLERSSAAADSAVSAAEEWVCPMHPRMTQTQPGKCSICGMDLVRSSELSAEDDTPPESKHSRSSDSGHSRSSDSGHSHGSGMGCCG